ncbi:hypothetical protein Fot_40855 [Forsythia ovata]|uniref:Uncharacterized protein n=1 Tax=Forsythia ovata TaxID=205694 RepID=A0ABD1RGK3_9LAMI
MDVRYEMEEEFLHHYGTNVVVENGEGNVEDQVHREESEIEQQDMEQTRDEVLTDSDYEAHEDPTPNMGAENSTLNIDFGIQDLNAQETNGEGTDYGEEDELESLDSENEDAARRPKSRFF